MPHCKRLALTFALLCVAPVTALAQGYLGVYTDATGASCNFADLGPGVVVVNTYVIHKDLPIGGAYAVRFKLQAPLGWDGLQFIPDGGSAAVGNMETDITVSYQNCVTGMKVAGVAQWLSFGSTPTCSQLSLSAADGFPLVIVYDCSYAEQPGYGLTSYVNSTPQCCCDCIRTEQSTWGSVKALYQ